MKRFLPIFLFAFCLLTKNVKAQQTITFESTSGFPIVDKNGASPIVYDEHDAELISIAGKLFSEDIERVTSIKPKLMHQSPKSSNIILLGTVDNSSFIQELIKSGKININSLKGKWDAYHLQVVKNPFKGIASALVIVGSNKRGAAYGALELSRQMGVSPWHWWADVPVVKRNQIFFNQSGITSDAPKVKYRGFFINDEAPCFSRWTQEKFGGVNHFAYEKVFELLIRLKANYLWPAMWSNAFNDDDKLNPILADKWGIVMGTSHHEPMMRSQREWKRYGKGPWDYTKNDSVLRAFWRKGIENMGSHESIVTMGMRGDGDEPMTQGTATQLLEKIVHDQRQIITEVTKKPASETPQLWALYKEVQDYYDKGMRVPDDITLLLSDDNYGNIRKLPRLTDKPRAGGYGIYYHFDYVGDPRNYKWVNTNNIARVWEQMHLAYEYGVNNIWIVNVGDIKPMEFPISFFMDYAWDPTKWDEKNIRNYYTNWAAMQFGTQYAPEIGNMMRDYAKYVSRRKPELLNADNYTYSIENYEEMSKVVEDYKNLESRAEKMNQQLPEAFRSAFYQVVLHPIKANANLNEMYEAAAWNKYYANHNDTAANRFADKVVALFAKDSMISIEYNKELLNGKWNHMMDQVHIGYTSWNDPKHNIMPSVKYVDANAQSSVKKETTKDVTTESLIPSSAKGNVFFEKNGYVSVEATNYTKAINNNKITWTIIPDIGRTGDGLTTFPVTAANQNISTNSPHTEYDFYVDESKDSVSVAAYFSPTLNIHNDPAGLQYGVSIDNGDPQIFTINVYTNPNTWRGWTASNIIIKNTKHAPLSKGKHTLKYWMIQSGVIAQKFVVDLGGVRHCYLGPPETLKK